MTLTTLRKNFHKLIDEVEDKELLDQFYRALTFSTTGKDGELWDNLTKSEKVVLMKSYEESKDKKNLVSHEKVMQKYAKWLKK